MGFQFVSVTLVTYGLLAISGALILDTSDAPRTVVQVLTAGNGGQWGEWSQADFCPDGYFANGFHIKLEDNQGSGDDTAMNGIRLICRRDNTTEIREATSGSGPWGTWRPEIKCDTSQNQYLVAFHLKEEKPQGFGDDTAMDYIQFQCRSFYGGRTSELYEPSQDIGFGQWGLYSAQCPPNSAICGLTTKWEKAQNIGTFNQDDTALNDVVFYCCSD